MSHPLKKAPKLEARKREPLRTPEGESFRKEAGKLDNWLKPEYEELLAIKKRIENKAERLGMTLDDFPKDE